MKRAVGVISCRDRQRSRAAASESGDALLEGPARPPCGGVDQARSARLGILDLALECLDLGSLLTGQTHAAPDKD